MYYTKLICTKDRKVAEFNFKLIHNILPCSSNLVKWKKLDDKNCSLCNEEEDVMHMLFNCQFAKIIWQEIGRRLGFTIKAHHVFIRSSVSVAVDQVISITSYLIYKAWLMESLNGQVRTLQNCQRFILSELKQRKSLYITLGWDALTETIAIITNT